MKIAPIECPKRADERTSEFYVMRKTLEGLLSGEIEEIECGFDSHDHMISSEQVREQYTDRNE